MLKQRVPLKGRIERFRIVSKMLADNPLGDPHRREVTVYLPPNYDRQPNRRYPVFVDIVGFFGSGQAHVNWRVFEENIPERHERLVRQKKMGEVILVFPDCWTRLGGNQYINSPGVGRYADYLLREVVPDVERRYRTYGDRDHRAVFGKSSGGYGAIVHAMKYASFWGAAACHSGDMYFDFLHRVDFPRLLRVMAKHKENPGRFMRWFYGRKKMPSGDNAHIMMFLAMAATYDPAPKSRWGFRLPLDLHTGEVDEKRWKLWLTHDPIHLVRNKTYVKNLKSLRGLFIDCGTVDQYNLLYGARILHRRLTEAGVSHEYQEFEDDHSAIDYRMDVSLPWLYRRLMR